jgi:hypothetical protein
MLCAPKSAIANWDSGPVRIAATSNRLVPPPTKTLLPAAVSGRPQPDVSLLTSAPLLDASADGNAAFFAYPAAPGQPMAAWSAATPQQFAVAQTSPAASDLTVAGDRTPIASRVGGFIEIRDQNLALRSVDRTSELVGVPNAG